MNSKSKKHIVNKRFADVKKDLDPSKSYLIFENELKQSSDSILAGDLPIYQYLERQGFTWQKARDMKLCRQYLIVQTEPGDEDQILGRLMGCALPKDIVCYVYKANKSPDPE